MHLKRFHWTAYLRNKVDTYVEFPLRGLDMKCYLLEVRCSHFAIQGFTHRGCRGTSSQGLPTTAPNSSWGCLFLFRSLRTATLTTACMTLPRWWCTTALGECACATGWVGKPVSLVWSPHTPQKWTQMPSREWKPASLPCWQGEESAELGQVQSCFCLNLALPIHRA